jgi:periplasmic protein TonB
LARFFHVVIQNIAELLIIKSKIMSKLNINKNEWLELVFEGKNKANGAYQLRQEDGRTTVKAFLISLLFLGSLVGLGALFSSFTTKNTVPAIPNGPIIHVTDVVLPPKKDPTEKVIPKGTAKKVEKTTDLTENIRVVKKEEAPETPITKTIDVGVIKDPTAEPGGDGKGTPKGSNVLPTTTTAEPAVDITTIMDPASVDKNPLFPGDFSKEIAKKFVAPDMEEDKILKVFVYFVVERDGTISNIKVARDPGYGMGAEAIRVLKAIKTKWEPGMFKGQAVRTSFSLPITIKVDGNN